MEIVAGAAKAMQTAGGGTAVIIRKSPDSPKEAAKPSKETGTANADPSSSGRNEKLPGDGKVKKKTPNVNEISNTLYIPKILIPSVKSDEAIFGEIPIQSSASSSLSPMTTANQRSFKSSLGSPLHLFKINYKKLNV